MKEFRIKILDIDINEYRKKIKELNGKKNHSFLKYVRAIFNRCNATSSSYVRIKNEDDIVNITVKIFKGREKNDRLKEPPERYDITINQNFETGRNLLKALNLKEKAFQEVYTEKWTLSLNNTSGTLALHGKAKPSGTTSEYTVFFYLAPGLPIYMEIDCESKDALDKIITLLRVEKNKIRLVSFVKLYNEYYDISTNDYLESLTFNNIQNELKPLKNKELFHNSIKEHKKMINELIN
ncbi:MAG: hypothetical protein Edafosvirus18_2 [Edafosvirus sp.]|uniref:CYTH domain-containing protein n=1 Tax=Edafosvirus sp. TaxID=2487765 RepID=A0A3G4ZYA2_9VIRU|nr:MAG: hypothetical protein Edafosvirus18_2 [Edafosvirus sp.]